MFRRVFALGSAAVACGALVAHHHRRWPQTAFASETPTPTERDVPPLPVPAKSATKAKKERNLSLVVDGAASSQLELADVEVELDTEYTSVRMLDDDETVRVYLTKDKDDDVITVAVENSALVLRRVIGARIDADSGVECDVVDFDKDDALFAQTIVAPAERVVLFRVRPRAGAQSVTLPRFTVWQRAADFRHCDSEMKVCLAVNAVSPERSVVRITNKHDEDLTWTFSFDGTNCTFVSPAEQRVSPPYTIIVPGRHHGKRSPDVDFGAPTTLGSFVATDASKPWSHRWHFSYAVANAFAQHEYGIRYRLPFRVGEGAPPVSVSQAPGGTFSHQGKYAYDFGMDEGTEVLAMRAGVVSAVTMHNTMSKFADGICPPPVTIDCKAPNSDANVVVVLHDDGTYSQYAHLKHASAKVKVGDYVSAGQPLAESGNTGFSTSPHLHVDVFVRGPQAVTHLPVLFRDPSLPLPPFDETELPDDCFAYVDQMTGRTAYACEGQPSTFKRPFRAFEHFPPDRDVQLPANAKSSVMSTSSQTLQNTFVSPVDGVLVLKRGDKWNVPPTSEST